MIIQRLEDEAGVLFDKFVLELGAPASYAYPKTAIWNVPVILRNSFNSNAFGDPHVYNFKISIHINNYLEIFYDNRRKFFKIKDILDKSLSDLIDIFLKSEFINSALEHYRISRKNDKL